MMTQITNHQTMVTQSSGSTLCQSDACHPNPCVNGTCNVTSDGYQCKCTPGFMGKNCDEDIKECQDSKFVMVCNYFNALQLLCVGMVVHAKRCVADSYVTVPVVSLAKCVIIMTNNACVHLVQSVWTQMLENSA